MAKKKQPRKRTRQEVETAVLAKSARRCTLCFHLKGDLTEKHGQIAHLDQDRTNRAENNLAWMCLEHHSLYDSKTKQHKNYTIAEVRAARSKLYTLVEEGKHLTPTATQPDLEAEADKPEVVEVDDQSYRVLQYMRKADPREVTVIEIRSALLLDEPTIRSIFRELRVKGLVSHIPYGGYRLTPRAEDLLRRGQLLVV